MAKDLAGKDVRAVQKKYLAVGCRRDANCTPENGKHLRVFEKITNDPLEALEALGKVHRENPLTMASIHDYDGTGYRGEGFIVYLWIDGFVHANQLFEEVHHQ